MNFDDILSEYRRVSFSETDKGDRFERLMQAYLQTDPKYSELFTDVWLWKDFFARSELGGHDTGIDLVARTIDGDYWAIQCKCYQDQQIISKDMVDGFLSTSSKSFKDEKDLKTTKFPYRLWISTTNRWGSNAEKAIENQDPPVVRLNLSDLREAKVDWEKLEKGIHGEKAREEKKQVRTHQKEAIEKAVAHFAANDRGKLIMACGTGKTYTALKIAETLTKGTGTVLFLVPSIALLGQTLREWFGDADERLNAVCVCSDAEVSRQRSRSEDGEFDNVVDLAYPASTNPQSVVKQFRYFGNRKGKGLTVVFSTYQSIDVVSKAQEKLIANGFPEFDLIICDEAHRTTGVTLAGEDESAFTKVHDNTFIKAKKRLYMTATPRLYSDDAKGKAAQADAILCSMDNADLYGEEFYRIGFGEAVERDLLTDYKVLILTLSDSDVPPAIQDMIANRSDEINADDASKLIGCINALSKQILGDDGELQRDDPSFMKRAVAFCPKITASKKITGIFNAASDVYTNSLPETKRSLMVNVASEHVDGTMSAPERDRLLSWLKQETPHGDCRILTNVRCLSEGVDVPSLDAVMFLAARNSQVDVVQSVGRVMRKAPGKKYGYIIIPVVIPSDVEPEKALDNNERYKVVWTVLNALRAHDDRFNATVNKIELNKNRPTQILVGQPEVKFQNGQAIVPGPGEANKANKEISQQLSLQFVELQNAVFAKMVQKVGDRRYWEQWASNVAEIAERQVERIKRLIADEGKHRKAFDKFLKGLQKNINPSITEQEAIEMLSQHVITKPVFEALFENYSFVQNNPVSRSMQSMLDLLEAQAIEKDTETLQKFYDSVKMRASGIDNAEGKQRIILELYDKFFKTAFPKMVDRLGIVYTPVEVVDFIVNSVNDILKQEFGCSLSDENVNILDPFTGTGTFITRLIQSGHIKPDDLERKYRKEIFANEIVLLAYYIAAVNIENTFHDAAQGEDYIPFEGICLTDTFQLGESAKEEDLYSEQFPQNSKRVQRQKKAPLRVIFGNPPYSVGQKSANDNAQNQKYERLDGRIADTYAKATKATNKNSLYDSYIKAFRWSADRIDPQAGGVIAFVTNGSWIDGNAQDGFRKTLEKEFSSIWVFNLRGNQRTSGELSRKEGGKIFGSGSRTPIALTFLVKNPNDKTGNAEIHYRDIGDYLTREEKLAKIGKLASVSNSEIRWETLEPNEHGDWITLRNDAFQSFIPIATETQFDTKTESIFVLHSPGSQSNRDPWVYNSSRAELLRNIERTISSYNELVSKYVAIRETNPNATVDSVIERDEQRIKWTPSLLLQLERQNNVAFQPESVRVGLYRPYFKQQLYLGEKLIHRPAKSETFFPPGDFHNRVICISGVGDTKSFSTLVADVTPDVQLQSNGQCFPLYYYEETKKANPTLFDRNGQPEYIRRDGISDFILGRAREQYGNKVTKEDIFYYVYGFLHSPEYREKFANDLKKMLPRLPLVDRAEDFWAFSRAGRKLADLHINYESVPPHPELEVTGVDSGNFRVGKMRFPDKKQKDTISFNSSITVKNIPQKAYDYVVNGKSAIEWIMDRYQVKQDKPSGIINDPNDWSEEVGNPRYILDLLLSIVNVSTQTVDIVGSLPKLEFE